MAFHFIVGGLFFVFFFVGGTGVHCHETDLYFTPPLHFFSLRFVVKNSMLII